MWACASGACVQELQHGGGDVWVTTVLFSPDGSQLAAHDEYDSKQWKAWDVATGEPVVPVPDTAAWPRTASGAAAAAFAVSADGAAAVTVRPAGAADTDADTLRFSPAETLQSKGARLIPAGSIAVVRGTDAPPLILVPRGLDMLGLSLIHI